MRLEQLEFFVEAGKSRSMRAAADKLHVTPQNVSKAIKQLENELQVELFTRSYQGVFLTEAGQAVYALASEALDKIHLIPQTVCPQGQAPTLAGRLSIATSIPLSFMASAMIADFSNEHPALAIQLTEWEHPAPQDLLKNCPYQMILLSITTTALEQYLAEEMKNHYHCYLLKKEALHLFMSKISPLTAKKIIPLKTLAQLPLVAYAPKGQASPVIQSVLCSFGVKLNNILRLSNFSLCLQYVAEGRYYFLSSDILYNFISPFLQNMITVRPLSQKISWDHYVLIAQSEAAEPPVDLFFTALQTYFHSSMEKIY